MYCISEKKNIYEHLPAGFRVKMTPRTLGAIIMQATINTIPTRIRTPCVDPVCDTLNNTNKIIFSIFDETIFENLYVFIADLD